MMAEHGYQVCSTPEKSDLILINTCSIRENAEQRIWGRLAELRSLKRKKTGLMIGIIGCMAERLKEKLMEQEQVVDIVVGPDAYRELPQLVQMAQSGQKGVNAILSQEETYAEIHPVRYDGNGVTAYVSIMRGCNNMCSYCVVPYTRGAERSRNSQSILQEIKQLVEDGYKEVTLLGQNVNSYRYKDNGTELSFAMLLEKAAQTSSKLRLRYSTSHPKDMSNDVLHVMAKYDNICKSIHLPAQSGSTKVLQLMNRKYSREDYLDRINAIRTILPSCSISTDLIAGFCTESEEDHQQTLSLMKEVGYDFAFMFAYSERPNTKASRQYKDDVPGDIKTRRLNEIIALQNELSLKNKQEWIGKTVEVLAEGFSKKSSEQLFGRTSQNLSVVFPRKEHNIGDYVTVTINRCTSATLIAD
ncbi:MAG: tRNA (N6-isopentenyl adenosine(37)-C2)-methylthiotransferase MiaB [Prevotellaceae bacterium]|nr:tRNA (N6-isopentenyl adenosine(37)-C2)-methylthiotransferase MiaB [Prevotellaceae bacterium]